MDDQKLCIRCNKRPVNLILTTGVLGKACSRCILNAISALGNPYCEFCMGERNYYWHSDDCDSEDCSLAGGYDDCKGQMMECTCSIVDGIFI